MLVGVDEPVVTLLATGQLQRAIGDDLIGVHVGRRTGSALDHVDDELVMQLPTADLLTGTADRVESLVVEQAQIMIG